MITLILQSVIIMKRPKFMFSVFTCPEILPKKNSFKIISIKKSFQYQLWIRRKTKFTVNWNSERNANPQSSYSNKNKNISMQMTINQRKEWSKRKKQSLKSLRKWLCGENFTQAFLMKKIKLFISNFRMPLNKLE